MLFRAESLADAITVFGAFTDFTTPTRHVSPVVLAILLIGFASHLLGSSKRLAQWWSELTLDLQVSYWLLVAVGVLLLSSKTEKFIYFQF